jgi:hypothetical protein
MPSSSATLVAQVWIVFISRVRCFCYHYCSAQLLQLNLQHFIEESGKNASVVVLTAGRHSNGCTWCCCNSPRQVDTLPGDQVHMNLHRLQAGKSDASVDALRAALEQLQVGFMSRQVSVKSVRLGQ